MKVKSFDKALVKKRTRLSHVMPKEKWFLSYVSGGIFVRTEDT